MAQTEQVEEGAVAEQVDEENGESAEEQTDAELTEEETELEIFVNETPVTLTGKKEYVFVDLFDFYEFDLSDSRGRAIITQINGQNAQFAEKLQTGDKVTLAWKEN